MAGRRVAVSVIAAAAFVAGAAVAADDGSAHGDRPAVVRGVDER